MRQFVCDMVLLECWYRKDVIPTGRDYGRSHFYQRCFCGSDGLYKDKPCPHCLYTDNEFKTFHFLIPRKKQSRDGKVKIVVKGKQKGRADYV